MTRKSSAMFAWRWSEVSVLGSQVFEQALIKSCAVQCSELTTIGLKCTWRCSAVALCGSRDAESELSCTAAFSGPNV